MWVEKDSVVIVTDLGQTGTGYTRPFYGVVQAVRYVKPGLSSDYAAGVDFAATVEDTGENVWVENNVDASAGRLPAQFSNDPDTGGEATTTVKNVRVAGSRIKIVVTSGGALKTGSFVVIGQGSFVG